jgi:hypothetical protein
MDDKHESRIIPFTARTGRGSGNGQEPPSDEEQVAAGNAYATARGTRAAASLRFLLHDGKSFAMPYAYNPIIWAESPTLLLLEYPRFFTVILAGLAGTNLGLLEDRLCERRITWIRECDQATAAALPVAVTRIERMHRYPSRELDGPASDK